MARLYANENFPYAVVRELRALGHDVLTSVGHDVLCPVVARDCWAAGPQSVCVAGAA